MNRFAIGVAAIALVGGGFSVANAAIVYNVNQSSSTPLQAGELSPLSDTVIGTITTDGTLGAVQSANITGWDLHLIDNVRPGDNSELTPANSQLVFDDGNALTASATQLSFDFGNAGGLLVFQGTTIGIFSGYQYLCFAGATGTCYAGESIVPYHYSDDGVLAAGVGDAGLNSVPEPAAWTMMLMGFFGVGAGLRSRRRVASLA